MHDKGMATLYVHGTIEGVGAVEFMVDTGASYLALNEETIRALLDKGHARYVRKLSAQMADGRKRLVPIYLLSDIAIGDPCAIKGVEAAVLPGSTRSILGLSALRKTAPFVFAMDPPALGLSHCAV
jgi:clan AA aspartic protease (TIGR02281 family)